MCHIFVSATAVFPSFVSTSKVPRSHLFSEPSLQIMVMKDLRTVKDRPRTSSTYTSSKTIASATENDPDLEKASKTVGRREAKILAVEKTCNLHTVCPHQPLKMDNSVESRFPMSFEAQRVELSQARSARLKRSESQDLFRRSS